MTSPRLIFMDGEFTGLRANGTEFVSLALVKDSGEELYLELEHGACDTWVQENVLPQLTGGKLSKEVYEKVMRS